MKRPNVRKPIDGDAPRNIEHICIEEIGEAMLAIIKQSIGLDKNILFVETARVFGFNRTGAKIQEAMTTTLDYLISIKEVVVNNNIVSLT